MPCLPRNCWEKWDTWESDSRNPRRQWRGYRCENNKHRGNPRSQHRRISKDREIKMHPVQSRNRVYVCEVSSNYRGIHSRSLPVFPSEGSRPIAWNRPNAQKSGQKKHERWREEEGENRLEIDKEDGVARRGEEQKKRLQRLSARKTPRNRRRQSRKGMGRWTR